MTEVQQNETFTAAKRMLQAFDHSGEAIFIGDRLGDLWLCDLDASAWLLRRWSALYPETARLWPHREVLGPVLLDHGGQHAGGGGADELQGRQLEHYRTRCWDLLRERHRLRLEERVVGVDKPSGRLAAVYRELASGVFAGD